MVVKLAAQMEAPISNNRPLGPIVFSADAAQDATRVVSVAWIPTSRGCTFVAAHASGSVFVYPKVSSPNAPAFPMGQTSVRTLLLSPLF